jgi:hypothetical protein
MFVIVLYQIVLIYNEKKKLFSGALKKKGQEFRDNYYSYSFPPEGGEKNNYFRGGYLHEKKEENILYI